MAKRGRIFKGIKQWHNTNSKGEITSRSVKFGNGTKNYSYKPKVDKLKKMNPKPSKALRRAMQGKSGCAIVAVTLVGGFLSLAVGSISYLLS